jgi:hypothetical protein
MWKRLKMPQIVLPSQWKRAVGVSGRLVGPSVFKTAADLGKTGLNSISPSKSPTVLARIPSWIGSWRLGPGSHNRPGRQSSLSWSQLALINPSAVKVGVSDGHRPRLRFGYTGDAAPKSRSD